MELFLKLEISQYVNAKIISSFSLKIDLWLILSTYCIGTQSLYCLYKMFLLIDIELFDKSQMSFCHFGQMSFCQNLSNDNRNGALKHQYRKLWNKNEYRFTDNLERNLLP